MEFSLDKPWSSQENEEEMKKYDYMADLYKLDVPAVNSIELLRAPVVKGTRKDMSLLNKKIRGYH